MHTEDYHSTNGTSIATDNNQADQRPNETKFVKIPVDDMDWARSQKPSVIQLFLECWLSDAYGSRWTQLTTKLHCTAFKKAKKQLSSQSLFIFKREVSIRDGRSTVCWLVRNLHGSRVKDFWKEVAPTTNKVAPTANKVAPTANKVAPATSIVSQTPSEQSFQNASRSFHDPIQDLFKREEEALLNFSEEEEKSQPQLSASLKANLKSAGQEPKPNEGKPSAAIDPVEIKAKLAALIGPLDGKDDQRPQRDLRHPIPLAYIEDVGEVLRVHRSQLEKLGIDLASEPLIETINNHSHNLEPAIEAFVEKCAKGAIDHPERFLNAALRQGWKPRNQSSSTSSPKKLVTPEFLGSYERLCAAGILLPEPPELLPVVMGQINVKVPRSNPKPWESPYDLMPWSQAQLLGIAAGQLPDIADDEW